MVVVVVVGKQTWTLIDKKGAWLHVGPGPAQLERAGGRTGRRAAGGQQVAATRCRGLLLP